MIARFITPTDSRWRAALTRLNHDIYHLPEYLEFSARHEGGRGVAFYAEAQAEIFLAPLLIRPLPVELEAPDEWRDAMSPYGYPSPLTTATGDANLLNRFWEALRLLGQDHQIVSAFFRFHPLLSAYAESLPAHDRLITHGQTVYIDLASSAEQLWQQTRENHRRSIRKLIQSGFRVEMDNWQLFDRFVATYTATMRRVAASDYYFFSSDYFADIRTFLGKHLHLCAVLSPADEVAAAGLFAATNGFVQYYLGGTADDYLHLAPSKLMFDAVRGWARQNGYRAFHLGGGIGCRADSLFQFKAGFSPARAEFSTFRMILDERKYQLLVKRWQHRFGESDADDTDFFPLYRKIVRQKAMA